MGQFTEEAFEEALANYIELAAAKTAERGYSNGIPEVLEVAPRKSKRYVKIVRMEHGEPFTVFAFINITNGDVLYPASYNQPAKHARGNIFADDPMKGTGPYGPRPLSNWRHGHG